MGIKNWTVTAEGVKSAASRELYFNDMNHPNHNNTERTVDIIGNGDTTVRIIAANEKRKMNLAKRKRGGRPPNEAQEFIFTLPKGDEFRPTPEQWKGMVNGMLRDMCEYLNAPSPIWGEDEDGKRIKVGEQEPKAQITPSDLNGFIRATVHQQDQDGTGTGDHAHVMIGNYIPKLDYGLPLNHRGVLKTLKMSFNEQVKNTIGICNSEYIAKKRYKGIAKKKVPKWKADIAKKGDIIKDELEYMRRAKLEHRFELMPELNSLLNKIEDQFERLDKYKEEGNAMRFGSTLNRVEKTIKQVDEIAVKYEDNEALSSFSERIKQRVDQAREQEIQQQKDPNQKHDIDSSKIKL
ncbi:hypothetical protein, partial [Vibrio sp. 10N]|uniref:hypothetical protein n=1 Tax=Vibrio sp. 10N TaxID=3058938 RepID=UPI0028142604|nr:hypothetical protein VB10N_47090 [Vibrio sp. 10N]